MDVPQTVRSRVAKVGCLLSGGIALISIFSEGELIEGGYILFSRIPTRIFR